MELAERLSMLMNLSCLPILQVACEDHHVGMIGMDAVYGLLHEREIDAGVATDMDIGELHYPIAVESGWERGEGEGEMTHAELCESSCHAIAHDIPQSNNQEQSDEVALGPAAAEEPAAAPPYHRTKKEDKGGNRP